MIHSSGNRILLGKSGRSAFLFDVDELHDRLSASFRACDIKNIWMVDDILIALHCGLKESKRPFRNSEEDKDQLHASLLKVLSDNGFSQVADHFRNSLHNNSLSILEKRIESELSNFVTAFSRRSVLLICDKITSLGYDVENISSLLIREICRLECQQSDTLYPEESVPESRLNQLLPFSEEFASWNWKVLKFRAVGNLFNSIRIEVNPHQLAKDLEMMPFMEITFMNSWQAILTEASNYLENCLLDLEGRHLEKIDYFTIQVRGLKDMAKFCETGSDSPFIYELYQSLETAFESVVSQFSNVPIRRA